MLERMRRAVLARGILIGVLGLAGAAAAQAQETFTGSGATLFQDYFNTPASTNDWIDANQDGYWGFNTFVNGSTLIQQLASPASINGASGAVTYSTNALGSAVINNADQFRFTYRSVGSVEGFGEFINYQLTGTTPSGVASEIQRLNRNTYVTTSTGLTYGPNAGTRTVTTVAAPYADSTGAPVGQPMNRVDFSFLDVPSTFAVQAGTSASAQWNRKPTQAGYGINPVPSSTNFVSELPSLTIGSQSLNQNTANPDADTIFDYTAAWVPVNVITNHGTGKEELKATELQHHFVAGRLPSGENLIAATRDAGSGTRNAAMNSLGIDPAWGKGDNLGDRSDSSSTDLVGANFQPTNKGGSSRMEGAVQNARLAIGYTGYSGSSRAVADTASGLYEIIAVMNDHTGGTLYVRPDKTNIVDNADPSTGYRIGGLGSFVTRGDAFAGDVAYDGSADGLRLNPGADGVIDGGSTIASPQGDDTVDSAPWELSNGGTQTLVTRDPASGNLVANDGLRDYLRNIKGSIDSFLGGAEDATNNMPGQFLAFDFFLPESIAALPSLVDPTSFNAQAVDPTLRATVLANQQSTSAFGAFSAAGRVPTRANATGYSDEAARVAAGGAASSGQYVTAGGVLVASGNLSVRNKTAGDFNNDGLRSAADVQSMVDAYYLRTSAAARATWAANHGGDTGAIFEVLGDFDADGNFDQKDLRYWADGLHLTTTAGLDLDGDAVADPTLNRKDGFAAVDNASLAAGGALNFFGVSKSTWANDLNNVNFYNAGDARGDIAGSVTGATAGAKPMGSDGVIDATDVQYVYDQFLGLADKTMNWLNLDDAAFGDLSADMNGDLIVNINDVKELVGIQLTDEIVENNPYPNETLLGILHAQPGDFNLDGVVDFSDVNIWQSNFNAINATYMMGDANFDFVVDFNDLNGWQANFNQLTHAPEPGTAVLLAVGGLGLMVRRRRNA